MTKLASLLRYISRYRWGSRLVMRLFLVCGSCFFPFLSIWPVDDEHIKVIVFATNEFQWKQCLSQFNSDSGNDPAIVMEKGYENSPIKD